MLRKLAEKQAKSINTTEEAISFTTTLAKTHIIDDDILEEAKWKIFTWAGLLSIKGLKGNGVWSARVSLFVNEIVDLVEKQEARFESELT